MTESNSRPTSDEQKGWETPGIILRRVRRERGLGADQVCGHLGLTQRALKALEADDYDRLPASVYVRGYIRRYCDLLSIREEPVLDCYESYHLEMSGNTAAIADPVGNERSRRARWYLVTLVAALAVGLLLWAAVGWGTEGGADDYNSRLATARVQQQTTSAASGPDSAAIARHSAPTETTGKTAASESGDIPADPNHIQLHFDQDSWIEIFDAEGETLVVELRKAGTDLELTGEPPFDVRLGYGPGVPIRYLGKTVPVSSDAKTHAARLLVGK